MKNLEVARLLDEIADILDFQGVTFKPEAYRRAARNIGSMSQDLGEVWEEGRLASLPGVGKAISEKIAEYLETGSLAYHQRLLEEVPRGVLDIMHIPGVGPKTAKLLHQRLGVASVEELKEAAREGRLEGIKGLGPKKAENILRGIAIRASTKGRKLLGEALPVAEGILDHLSAHAPVHRMSVAGSLRRMQETVGDIDILVTSPDPPQVMATFTSMAEVAEVLLQGETKSSVVLKDGTQTDLRVLDEDSFGSALQYFTGSKDHNIQLRSYAMGRGLKVNEYGVFRGEERLAGATEEEVYAALELPFIEPEMRQARGEIEAAREGRLPHLLTLEDLRGDLHVHTNRTDGHDSLEAMVEAAQARGYDYVGISDHSQSVYIARGMKEEDIRMQMAEIRALRREVRGIRILHGSEVDILEGGELDYPDDVLQDLDYVIAAVHSHFNLPEEKMTERVLTAMANEHVDILAHPTGRKIGEREAVALDMGRVLEAAVDTHTALEINAFPQRLDLNGAHARVAKETGAKLAINTDAHSTLHLDLVKFGLGQARRGWVEPGDVLNALPYEDLVAWLQG